MLRCYTMAKQPYIFLSKQALSVSRKIQTRRFTANGSFGALAQQRKRTTEGISFRVIVVLHDLLVSRSDSLCVFSPLPQQTRMAGLQDAIFVLQTVGFFYCVSAFLWCFSSNLKITFIFFLFPHAGLQCRNDHERKQGEYCKAQQTSLRCS